MITTSYESKIKFFCTDQNNVDSELNISVKDIKPDSDAFISAATTFCNYVIDDNNTDMLKDDYGHDTNAVGYIVSRIEKITNDNILSGGIVREVQNAETD